MGDQLWNIYFNDTWKLKPNLTLTYGLNYQMQYPPTEANGVQDVMVYASSNQPVYLNSYYNNVLNAANFDAPGALGSTRISGILSGSSGSANNTTAASQEPYRIGLGTGVYSFGAPRQLEFGLKVNF